MSYTLTCLSEDGYLRINVDGEKQEDLIIELFYLWDKHQSQLLLIDIRSLKDTPSVVGDYYDAKCFADVGFTRVRQIAILDTPDRHKSNHFFETTANNRGLTVRFFYAEEHEAINWLLPED